ncbi:MAG: endonuclease/exonuclease/phosphatase family protein [Phycisphaeraceae bacterium]|nr:endonuclease/exonuclease/phosphatase family protein [Phycisphaeraceae bacterium]MCW5755152.1 endonuclease/exonuclease/phosphatase family protein [Phycisphaeraceae bacterium]
MRVLLVLWLVMFVSVRSVGQPPAPAVLSELELKYFMRFGEREARPKAPDVVRIATYNLENLFDDVDDPALTGRFEDAEMATPPERLVELAKAIRMVDADILAVQEIENLEVLTWFRDTYLEGLGYDHIASIDAGDARGIEQSVLSRFPIVHVQNWVKEPLGGVHPEKWGRSDNWYAGQPITFHRSPLRVDVRVPAGARGNDAPYALTLFVVHQKSGREGDYWREAEARGLVKILEELAAKEPERNILILGDFNAERDARSVQMYFAAGYTDLFEGVPSSSRIMSHESDRRIDMILFNKAIRPELVLESRFVLGTPARLREMSWRDPPPPGYASDHYPVVVDLRPVEGGGAPTAK